MASLTQLTFISKLHTRKSPKRAIVKKESPLNSVEETFSSTMHEAISITGEFNATYLQFKATHQEVSEKSNREERISVEFCGRKIFQYQA